MKVSRGPGFGSRPAVLDRPHRWVDADHIRALTGERTWADVAARECSTASPSGAVRFKISERDDAWVYVILDVDGVFALETGRMMVGGSLDGAWIPLGFHEGVPGSGLASAVRSCGLEV